ncbi:molybdenum cofactor biosynthesis protein B [uncultured Hyphomicrobium sp.]|uniref:molybdenum cofactor biosynthesis protein B n=1 Tax=uncultured Hyphomicrobium sp. TaxID=194373 RepID=UPI0025EAC70B|nr:molybdenum cofactor biosynthesis protein B [uncultured Hyphomicrobium sp.]
MNRLDETRPFIPLRIAILTMSDTRTAAEDKSGDTLAALATDAGHTVAARALLKDDADAIRAKVAGWIADPEVDVVITTGGTGFTGRDVTPEAVKPLFEKEIDGFAILFHQISFASVGTSTIQSRACGGIARGTLIFCLPGSTGACKDAWNGILKWQLDNRHRPCNFVEIMPRFEEHRVGLERN